MLDLVKRLEASSCNELCLMGRAAQELKRLYKIEAAAVEIVDYFDLNDDGSSVDRLIEILRKTLKGEE